MKRVITYGTFDLFHIGHFNILKRAKELGDYLVVGVTTENYDKSRGKLNVVESLVQRIDNVKKTGFADEIIVEEYEGQKITDIQKYNIDIFAIGSDWIGKFDYIKKYCSVVYLERTKGVSSTKLRLEHKPVIGLGMVGYGRIAQRFILESKFVSGVNVEGVFGHNIRSAELFAQKNEINFHTDNYNELLKRVNAVYIASPHLTHYHYAKTALENGKHVLCEKPMVLSHVEAQELLNMAKEKKLVLLEAIKTAFAPAFNQLLGFAHSGQIGDIKSVDATFTKLIPENKDLREFREECAGGSVTELSSYPLFAIFKLLGCDIKDFYFCSNFDPINKIDLFTKIQLIFENAIGSAMVGIGAKSEGALIVTGTEGYIYVPAPWWKTEYYEVRFEDIGRTKKYFIKFEEDGLRYEIAEFISMINSDNLSTYKLIDKEMITIASVIEDFRSKNNLFNIK